MNLRLSNGDHDIGDLDRLALNAKKGKKDKQKAKKHKAQKDFMRSIKSSEDLEGLDEDAVDDFLLDEGE